MPAPESSWRGTRPAASGDHRVQQTSGVDRNKLFGARRVSTDGLDAAQPVRYPRLPPAGGWHADVVARVSSLTSCDHAPPRSWRWIWEDASMPMEVLRRPSSSRARLVTGMTGVAEWWVLLGCLL